MAKPQIDIFDAPGGYYYLAWWSLEDGPGLCIGEKGSDLATLAQLREAAKRVRTEEGLENFETVSAEMAATSWFQEHPDLATYLLKCYEERDAKKLLKVVIGAVEQARIEYASDVPMPDWAQEAFAAGFKAPKGWKP